MTFRDLLLPGGYLAILDFDGSTFVAGSPGATCEGHLVQHISEVKTDHYQG